MFRKILLTHSTPLSVNPERVKRVEGLILVTGLFIFGMNKLSFAMMCGEHSEQKQMVQAHTEHEQGATETTKQVVAEEPVNAGNKICPVSGEEIKEGETYQVEYEDKIYNLCCKACMKDFKKDPQKYLKKVEEELEAEDKEKPEEKEQMPVGMHEGHPH